MHRVLVWVVLLASIVLISNSAMATNGMETTASGGRAAGMGGADLAVSSDTTALNTNPAGLIQIKKHRFDLNLGMMIPTLHFKNVSNDESGALQVFPMPAFAYGYRFQNAPVAIGVGIFSQGGMGASFKLLHPVIDPTEEQDYRSFLAFGKLAFGVAYQPHPIITIGAAVNLGVSMMSMKMPFSVKPSLMEGEAKLEMAGGNVGTTTYGQMFGGMLGYDELTAIAELKNSFAFGFGGKIGLTINPHKMVSIGIVYTLKSKLKFKGRASMDMSGQFDDAMPKMYDAFAAMPSNIGATPEQINQGIANFFTSNDIDPTRGYTANYDANIDFAWPRKLGLGIAIKPIETVLIAIDVHWIQWSDSMKIFTMSMSNGDNININNMIGSDKVKAELPLNWKDQFPVAIGIQWEFIEDAFARLGYNYGKNPVPSETVFPVFPAIVEHHITVGGGYNYNDFFEINFSYEIALPNSQTASDAHDVASEYNNSQSTLAEHTINVMGSFTY